MTNRCSSSTNLTLKKCVFVLFFYKNIFSKCKYSKSIYDENNYSSLDYSSAQLIKSLYNRIQEKYSYTKAESQSW